MCLRKLINIFLIDIFYLLRLKYFDKISLKCVSALKYKVFNSGFKLFMFSFSFYLVRDELKLN